jgi:hypothetical protein
MFVDGNCKMFRENGNVSNCFKPVVALAVKLENKNMKCQLLYFLCIRFQFYNFPSVWFAS